MKSIRGIIIRNFLIIILAIIVFLNIFLTIFVKKYYYDSTEDLLKNQIQVSTKFYSRYFSSASLIENIYDNIDSFWNDINAQVEILDQNGKLLMDSIGIKDEIILGTPDIHKALNGEIARWVGDVKYYDSKVMVVSAPLMASNKIVGVIRIITSLEDIDSIIKTIQIFFVAISVLVLIIGVIMSIIMANKIIDPVKSLIKVAEKMASGDLSTRSTVIGNNEISKLSSTLNFMADELEKREQLKNEFISSVSHELRTPLTAIKGWVITINNESTDKDTLKMGFDVIEKETDRLTVMVEELLDFSRFINDKITLKMSYIDIELLVRHIENFMKPRAKKEGLDLKVNITGEFKRVYLDKNRFKQVLINILDNAFKFTESGGKVSLDVFKSKDFIKFVIKDTGCGIPEDDLPKVKEKFFKGKNSKSQNGIGLSICDEIIKLHKGNFNIRSIIGIGTTIEISIPIEGE